MEKNNILNADVLDIIFDGRNKQYGAYQLRKTYNKRLIVAVSVMFGMCLLAVAGSVFARSENNKKAATIITTDVFNLADVKEKPPLPPPPPPKPLIKMEVLNDAPPKIVDEPVPPLPTQADMNDMALGPVKIEGVKGGDNMAPPVEISTTVPKEPVHEETNDMGMIVQVQASFPGGAGAWVKYLQHNLRQDVPVDNGAPQGDYQVVVSFIVDKDGAISQVKAENDPGYGIAAEAERVIQKSGKWVPAIQNGHNVTYRQKQPITFRVSEQ